MKTKYLLWSSLVLFCSLLACKQENTTNTIGFNATKQTKIATAPKKTNPQKHKDFNSYWNAGKSEISSYKLEQVRYGEIRQGHAVLVYVTEPFLNDKQVKADNPQKSNIPVLKLNSTKKFNTGIYPYSIMQSTFFPISNDRHALKVSCSVQEWCGHVYSQLNNKVLFDITSHSYFEDEADQKFSIEKTYLENELWTQLRINPVTLPTGTFEAIPSLEFLRLKHKPLKAYKATAELKKGNYTITFPELNRSLNITFNPEFPYTIEHWTETTNGLTTTASKLKTINTPYWNKNSNKDEVLRKTLQLK